MPTATDLVTDLPADFEVFGQAVATSMADLLGGTTGQVLAKASNADMDFVWSADAAGMTNPMTTTGDMIYSSPGSTPVRRAIGSTGQGLTVVAGIPAWAASATSTLTTTGDMLYASAANTLARVGIGSTGNVLTVAGGVPTWAAPAGGGGASYTLLNSGGTSLTGSSVTISSISGIEKLIVIVDGASGTSGYSGINLVINADTGTKYRYNGGYNDVGATYGVNNFGIYNGYGTNFPGGSQSSAVGSTIGCVFAINGGTGTSGKQIQMMNGASATGGNGQRLINVQGVYEGSAVITSIKLQIDTGTFDAGTIYVYGSAV
jgi:hypothetical protein